MNNTKILVGNILAQDAHFLINKQLMKTTNSDCAVLVAHLLEKEIDLTKKKEILEDGYFFNEQMDIQRDTSLSPYQQRKAIKILSEMDLITTAYRGIPQRLVYFVNHKNIMKTCINSKQSGATK